MGFLDFVSSIGRSLSGAMGKISSGISWVGRNIVKPAVTTIGGLFGLTPQQSIDKAKSIGQGLVNRGLEKGREFLKDNFGRIMGQFGFDHKAQQAMVAPRTMTAYDNPAKQYYDQQSAAMKYVKGEVPIPRQMPRLDGGAPGSISGGSAATGTE